MEPLHFEIELYLYDVIIFFDKKDVTEQQMKRLCTKAFKHSDNGKDKIEKSTQHFMQQYQMMIDNDHGGIATSYAHTSLVVLEEYNFDKAWFHSILAHEIGHVVYRILKRVGMKLSEESEEAFTYLTGYITKMVYRHLITQNKQKA